MLYSGKPGWNDAFNGLPGLCGSSTSEVVDLLALAERLETWLADAPNLLELPEELADFCDELDDIFSGTAPGFSLWNATALLRENWRAKTRFGLSGREVSVKKDVVQERLARQRALLEDSLARLKGYGEIPPTYFIHEAINWEALGESTPYGLPAVRVTGWKARRLPTFLETPAKMMRRLNRQDAQRLYAAIRSSELTGEGKHR